MQADKPLDDTDDAVLIRNYTRAVDMLRFFHGYTSQLASGAMSAYKDALALESGASEERIALAADMLAHEAGVVLFEGFLALRPAGSELLCEVIDSMPASHRCAKEYQVLVENARLALEASKFAARLPSRPRRWLVVEDDGIDTMELWHAP